MRIKKNSLEFCHFDVVSQHFSSVHHILICACALLSQASAYIIRALFCMRAIAQLSS